MFKTSPSNAGGVGSIPGRGAKIPHASRPKNQSIKQKQYCNKFTKEFKNGPHKKNLKKNCPAVLEYPVVIFFHSFFFPLLLFSLGSFY